MKSLFCLTKTATTTKRNQGLAHLLKWQYPGDCHRRGALFSPLPPALGPNELAAAASGTWAGPGRAGPRLAGHEAGVPSCPPWIILDTRADPHRGGSCAAAPSPGGGPPGPPAAAGRATLPGPGPPPRRCGGNNRRRLAGQRAPLSTAATSPGRRARISPSASTPKVVPLCSPAAKVRLHLCPSAAALFLPAPWPRSCLSAQAGPAGAGPRPFVLPECTSFSSAGNKNGEGLRWSRAVCEAGLTPPPPPFLRCAVGSVLGGVPPRTEGPAVPGRRGEAPELADFPV